MKFSCLIMSILVLLSLYAFAAPNLDGNWKKACEDQDGDYVRESLKISKAQWNTTQVGYEDEKCTIKYLQFDQSFTVALTDIHLDLKLVDAAYTPLSDEVAEALNDGEFCEITTWKKNKKISIVGKKCSDVDNYEKNQMTYSIYKTSGIELFTGVGSAQAEGITPDTRHQIYGNAAYKKGN